MLSLLRQELLVIDVVLMAYNNYKIIEIIIDKSNTFRWTQIAEQERRSAVRDILKSNYFKPLGVVLGPYKLHIKLIEWRLNLDIFNEKGVKNLKNFSVSLTGIRRIIRDYQIVCDNYYEAIKTAPLKKIEAIDVGRKAIHNEGAEALKDLFDSKVNMDVETARRFFTLICVISLKL